MTTWQFELGDRLRSERGEVGKVISRAEALTAKGVIIHQYRLEGEPDGWGPVTRVWVPEYALAADDAPPTTQSSEKSL